MPSFGGFDQITSAVSKVRDIGNTLGTIKTSATALGSNISDIASKVKNGDFSNLMSAARFKNLKAGLSGATSSAPTEASFVSPGGRDWRVRLTIPTAGAYAASPLITPLLETGGLIFPYTPQITISHSASYQALDPLHNNYPFLSYQNSKADAIQISGMFYCEDAIEAQYWVGAVHYLRSVTKMAYGGNDPNAGSPPPVVRLLGYGDYVFNYVPVVVTNFSVELEDNVDYIRTDLTGVTGVTEDGSSAVSWAPIRSRISVTVQPLYSRNTVRNFNLADFVAGKYVSSGEGFL
jgi:hypothetical protein